MIDWDRERGHSVGYIHGGIAGLKPIIRFTVTYHEAEEEGEAGVWCGKDYDTGKNAVGTQVAVMAWCERQFKELP